MELGSSRGMDVWGGKTRREAGRICGINWTVPTVPRATVQTSHRLSLEFLCNVTGCICPREMILGTKCWQMRVLMLSEGAFALRRLEAVPVGTEQQGWPLRWHKTPVWSSLCCFFYGQPKKQKTKFHEAKTCGKFDVSVQCTHKQAGQEVYC